MSEFLSSYGNRWSATGRGETAQGWTNQNLFINANQTIFDPPVADGPDLMGYDTFNVTNLFLGAHSTYSLAGVNLGWSEASTMHAQNVFIGAGATLELGCYTCPATDGPTTINNLYNSGTITDPNSQSITNPNSIWPLDITSVNLQLGGPGFLIDNATAHTSETNDGHGHTVLNLGNISQTGFVGLFPTELSAILAQETGTFTFSSMDNGIQLYSPLGAVTAGTTETIYKGTPGAAPTLYLDQSRLGAHQATLNFTGPNVHDSLTIFDRVIPG